MKTNLKTTFLSLILLAQICALAQVPNPTTYTAGNGFALNKGQLIDTSGNLHPEIFYLTHAKETDYFFDGENVIYAQIKSDTIANSIDTIYRMDMIHVNSNALTVSVNDTSQGYLNYYLPHCVNGITNVPTYQEISYLNIYDRIDLTFHVDIGFNFTYKINVGGNPNSIKFRYDSATVSVTPFNTLVVSSPLKDIVYDVPEAAQFYGGVWHVVSVNYVVTSNEVSFSVGVYDNTLPLYVKVKPITISNISASPYMFWSTYFGGGLSDETNDILIDDNNKIYAVGNTESSQALGFPVINGIQMQLKAKTDAWVGKFNKDRGRDWVTFYGGYQDDYASTVGVNSTGDVYFAGLTTSHPIWQFPLCNSCVGYKDLTMVGSLVEGYLVKLNTAGQQFLGSGGMSTYFGGDGIEEIHTLTIDKNDNVFIGGRVRTGFNNFPIVNKTGAYNQPNATGQDECFIAKFDRYNSVSKTGNNLIWSTFIGGATAYEELNSLTNDAYGNIYATGSTSSTGTTPATVGNFLTSPCTANIYIGAFPTVHPGIGSYPNAYVEDNHGDVDAFVIKFNINNAIVWSTEFGGIGTELWFTQFHNNRGIAVSKNAGTQNIFITGSTICNSCTVGLPIPLFFINPSSTFGAYNQANYAGNRDAYLAKFDEFYRCDYSTLMGGVGDDVGVSVGYDNLGNLYTGGYTNSNPFPGNYTTIKGYSQLYGGGFDGYACKLNLNLNRVWGSYLGGTLDDYIKSISIASNGVDFILGGSTVSTNFPCYDIPGTKDYTDLTFNSGLADGFITNLYKICAYCKEENTQENLQLIVANNFIFPNPSAGKIQLNENIKIPIELSIYNSLGLIVHEIVVSDLNTTIDLSFLNDGIYLLKDTCGEISFKMVIQK